jgi:acyl-CoA reductase-like NAD-dependent aldehyde dehydrogenase
VFDVDLLMRAAGKANSSRRTFERINPLTGAVATRAVAATVEDACAAAASAAAAFPKWSSLGPSERRSRLNAAANELAAREGAFIEAMAEEIGATESWGRFNVELAASMLREAASMTTAVRGEMIPSAVSATTAMALRQPAGVVLSMAPWNAPVILGIRSIAMPLACGNTVVFKGSEICPRTHWLVGETFRSAGCDDGVVNVISNAPADASRVIEALIAHPTVRRVNFTGSTRVGRHIAEIAARHLKPVLLELGGKAPMVVLDDADLDAAVDAAAFGAFMNQGQICMSTERLIVDEAVVEEFLHKLAAKASTLVAGDPRKGEAPLGAMISNEAVERVQSLVRDAVAKGAHLVCGCHANGVLMDATLLDHVTPAMRIYREESFGPVAAIIRVNGLDEAVRVANDTEYGLAAAVFGRDISRALEVARRIESGICHINGSTVHDEAHAPFGGLKASGYGRFGGAAAIHEFTELRWITIGSTRRSYPI